MGVVRRRQLKKVITAVFREMTIKRSSVFFSRKNRVTPSVAASGDSNPSDATVDNLPPDTQAEDREVPDMYCTPA